jgi:hypothetical protein
MFRPPNLANTQAPHWSSVGASCRCNQKTSVFARVWAQHAIFDYARCCAPISLLGSVDAGPCDNTITLRGLQPENGVTRSTDKVSTTKNNWVYSLPNAAPQEACHDRRDTGGFKCDPSEHSRVPTDKKPSIPPLEVSDKG